MIRWISPLLLFSSLACATQNINIPMGATGATGTAGAAGAVGATGATGSGLAASCTLPDGVTAGPCVTGGTSTTLGNYTPSGTGVTQDLSIETGNSTGVNASKPGDITIKAGNKTAGTGVGGSISIRAGNSAANSAGSLHIGGGTDGFGNGSVILDTGLALNGQTISYNNSITSGAGPKFAQNYFGAFTSIASTPKISVDQMDGAVLIETVCISASAYTCSVSPTITLLDCTDGSCSSSPTTIVALPFSAGFPATCDLGSVSYLLADQNYLGIKVTGGTCTALNVNVSVQGVPQ